MRIYMELYGIICTEERKPPIRAEKKKQGHS